MRAIVIQSSSINAIAYDHAVEQLFVLFRTGKWYRYDSVPGTVVLEVLFADSVGTAFAKAVKAAGHAYEEINPEAYHLRV